MPMPRLNTRAISSSSTSPEPLDLGEDPRRLPRRPVDDGIDAAGQDAGDVAGQPAAGDVGDGLHVDDAQHGERPPGRR